MWYHNINFRKLRFVILNSDLLTSVDQSGDVAALKGDIQIKHMVTS